MSLTVREQKGGNIYEASRQWASRPPDQCFDSLQSMHDFCAGYKDMSEVWPAQLSTMRVRPHHNVEDDLVMKGPSSQIHARELEFTNFSFSQLCSNISCPSEFMSTLPSTMAADVMNYKLQELENQGGKDALLLVQDERQVVATEPNKMILRATTSKIYDRVWNAQVTDFLLKLNRHFDGRFQPPSVNWRSDSRNTDPSDQGGTGLYASDRDMFAFLVDKEKQLDISGAELVRGFFVSNNEVGSGSLKLCMFLCDYICGNHIIWDVTQAVTVSARHAGNAATETFEKIFPLSIALQVSKKASLDEVKIRKAQTKILGQNKEKTVDFIFEKRFATRRLAEAAWVSSDLREGVNPNSVWGMICGMTAMARSVTHYNKRADIEVSASKLMEVAA